MNQLLALSDSYTVVTCRKRHISSISKTALKAQCSCRLMRKAVSFNVGCYASPRLVVNAMPADSKMSFGKTPPAQTITSSLAMDLRPSGDVIST